MATLQQVKDNATLKQVLADSFGGIMYDVSNKDKYNSKEVLELWDSLPATEKEVAGGIVTGAINFLRG